MEAVLRHAACSRHGDMFTALGLHAHRDRRAPQAIVVFQAPLAPNANRQCSYQRSCPEPTPARSRHTPATRAGK